jgi:hypothetical protein
LDGYDAAATLNAEFALTQVLSKIVIPRITEAFSIPELLKVCEVFVVFYNGFDEHIVWKVIGVDNTEFISLKDVPCFTAGRWRTVGQT